MVKFKIRDLDVWFGPTHAIKQVNMEIQSHEILSVIGPSNSGKTTFLRTLNRLSDLHASFRMSGIVEMERVDTRGMDVETLRRKIGMVFALPLPLPLSIFENVAYGIRMLRRQKTGKRWKKRWKRRSSRDISGTRSKTGWMSRPLNYPAASSSACALQGPWRSSRK